MIKVLLALKTTQEINQVINGFYNEFKRKVHFVEISKESMLPKIEKFLDENADCNILILQENLDYDCHIKVEYLCKIRTKFPGLNIVYIIDNRHYESTYIRSIFDAGIYNGLFAKDASISNIVYISQTPRTEKEAESYYGLGSEIEKTYIGPSKTLLRGINRSIKKEGNRKSVTIKEKVIYKAPKDYQKIIGIYSPYSVGKTVISANLAMCYVINKINVTLIDTDYYKKDLIYYFPIENSDFLKLQNLYKDMKSKKEIDNVDCYGININKRLKLFSDHRDAVYKVTKSMLNFIVRNSDTNIVIVDVSRDLDEELVNEILSLCDERILVVDKMLSTLNGLPYKLNIKGNNKKKLKLIVNKDVKIRSFSTREIKEHFRDIDLLGKEKYSLDFDELFFIPDRYEIIAETVANRQVAYGKDREFDESIEKIAASLYQVDNLKIENKSVFKKLFKK